MTDPVLAVDVGGTKLAAALWHDGLGEPVVTPTGLHPWEDLVELLDPLADQGIRAIGVGCGGPMHWPAGIVSPLNIPRWQGFPLREELQRRYAVPVRLHNDAVCLAIAEHWQGGWGTDHLMGMVVSTGIGAGVVLDGRLLDGATGNLGHIGHVVVEPGGPTCTCGGAGCLEAVARGAAIVAWAVERGARVTTAVELGALAAQGDQVALQAFARAGRAIGTAIASAVALLDVRVVTIGGGLSRVPSLWPTLRRTVRAQARLGYLEGLRVEPAALGDRACLIGAAALVVEGDRYWRGD